MRNNSEKFIYSFNLNSSLDIKIFFFVMDLGLKWIDKSNNFCLIAETFATLTTVNVSFIAVLCAYMRVLCVCVCVCERERERDRARVRVRAGNRGEKLQLSPCFCVQL